MKNDKIYNLFYDIEITENELELYEKILNYDNNVEIEKNNKN